MSAHTRTKPHAVRMPSNMQLVQTLLSNIFDTIFTYVFVLLCMQILYPLLNAELLRTLSVQLHADA